METMSISDLSKEVLLLKKQFAEMKEDLEFARGTEEAWQEVDEGKCVKTNSKDFLKEIKKW